MHCAPCPWVSPYVIGVPPQISHRESHLCLCLHRVARGCGETFPNQFGFKEPWSIDHAAEQGGTEDRPEDPGAGLAWPGTLAVGERPTDSRVPGIVGTGETELHFHNIIPFKCNAEDDIDGAAEGDVIEREDDLGEEIGIELTVKREGPLVN